jgi:hypothetical protein
MISKILSFESSVCNYSPCHLASSPYVSQDNVGYVEITDVNSEILEL